MNKVRKISFFFVIFKEWNKIKWIVYIVESANGRTTRRVETIKYKRRIEFSSVQSSYDLLLDGVKGHV